MDIFGRYLWSLIGSIRANALETSSLSSSDMMLLLSRADLWFPLDRWKLLSDFLDSSLIGSRGIWLHFQVCLWCISRVGVLRG